tara:strand:+ start:643 stop:1053 length:411 start_codon:yes stop_codon:yes gene_type:complete
MSIELLHTSKPNNAVYVIKVNPKDGCVKRDNKIIIQDNYDGTFFLYNSLKKNNFTDKLECMDKPLSDIDKLINAFQETELKEIQETNPFSIIIYVKEERVLTATVCNVTVPISIDQMESFKDTDAIITEKFIYELV